MIPPFHSKFLAPTKNFRRFSVLLSIYNSPSISQSQIGRITHLSSSMVNNYIKELQEEGLIEIIGDTNRTLSYHPTPSGKNELMSLLIDYSTEIIQLYGAAKREVAQRLNSLHSDGVHTLALFGAAETAEIVHTAIKETPLTVIAVVDNDPRKQGKAFNGLIVQHPEVLKKIPVDAVVITSFGKQDEIFDYIKQNFDNTINVVKLTNL